MRTRKWRGASGALCTRHTSSTLRSIKASVATQWKSFRPSWVNIFAQALSQKLVEGGVVAVDELEENRVWDQANSAALSTGRREQFAAAQAPIEARASREAMKEHTNVLARIACGEAVHVHVLRKVISPDPAEPRSVGAGRQRGDSLFQFLQSRSGLFSLGKILLVALYPGFAALLEFGRRVVRLSELLLKAEAGGLAGSS